MNSFINRFFTFILFIGLIIPTQNIFSAWTQPPFQFPAFGRGIDMKSDANGNAITVLDNAGTVEAFFYSRLTNTWTGPTILGTTIGRIVLDMDPSGTALAVWLDPNRTDLHSAFFNGITWTPGSPDPFATAAGFIEQINLSMNGPNSALVTWIDDTDNTVFSNFFNSGTWSTTIPVAGPVVAGPFVNFLYFSDYSENGTAVATFLVGSNLEVSNFIGGSWQPPVTLDTSVPSVRLNGVTGIDANGHAVVVWVNNAGDVKASTFTGFGWTPAVTISTTGGNSPSSLSLGMSPSGTAVATWVDGAGVGFSSSFNGTTWGTPQIFASPVSDLQTSLSVNASGDALLLFQSPSPTLFGGVILSSRLPLGGVWSAPEFVHTPADSVLILISSLSDNGTGFAAWSEGVELFNYFASVEIPPAQPEPPPAAKARFCKNKFATQSECVNVITWTQSPTSTVVSYEIARNGVVIAVVPASGPFTFVDRVGCKDVSDVYTITAIDANGTKSKPVTVIVVH